MLKGIFRKRFKVGDSVKLIRTGQKAMIVDKGALSVGKKDVTTFVLKFENGSPSVKVLPDEIERAA